MNTSSELARNGMRQPKLKNCASLSVSDNNRNTPPEQMKPSGAPSWGNMPYQARLPGGAFSVASSTAPPHSPPRDRKSTSLNSSHSCDTRLPSSSLKKKQQI